jgi:hypothetical protein
MRKLLAAVIIGAFAITAAPAFAADNAQQTRMKDCNVQAKGKTGDERKKFMSACLSGKEAPAPKMTQQEKMKACNAKATDKKGDERKKFMSECLKG